jgi:O-antigen ligase
LISFAPRLGAVYLRRFLYFLHRSSLYLSVFVFLILFILPIYSLLSRRLLPMLFFIIIIAYLLFFFSPSISLFEKRRIDPGDQIVWFE